MKYVYILLLSINTIAAVAQDITSSDLSNRFYATLVSTDEAGVQTFVIKSNDGSPTGGDAYIYYLYTYTNFTYMGHTTEGYSDCMPRNKYVDNGSLKCEGPGVYSVRWTQTCYDGAPSPIMPCFPEVLLRTTRSGRYRLSWTRNIYLGNQPCDKRSPSTYTSQFYANVDVVVSQRNVEENPASPVSFVHSHRLENNLSFVGESILRTGEIFDVCADGSNASLFTVSGGGVAYDDLMLRLPQGGDPALVGSLTVLSQTPSGVTYRYTHPDYVGTNPLVSLSLCHKSNPNAIVAVRTIRINQAPTVLVHGLASDGKAFLKLEANLLQTGGWASGSTYRVDYSKSNTASFSTNKDVVPKAIDATIRQLIDRGVAAGKADIVGHSMGGILSRIYLQSDSYGIRRDLHKLITLNTPHSGTQLADYGLTCLQNQFTTLTTVGLLICNCGAFIDLRGQGEAIASLNNSANLNRYSVPSHVIATTAVYDKQKLAAVSNELTRDTGTKLTYFTNLCASTYYALDLNKMLGEDTHDFVVPQTSQLGGMSCRSIISGQVHLAAMDNSDVINRVKTLLAEPSTNADFCTDGYHPVKLKDTTTDPNLYNQTASPQPGSARQAPTAATLAITQPAAGKLIRGGAALTVGITGNDLKEIMVAVSYRNDTSYIARRTFTSGTTSFSMTLDTISGNRSVFVVGRTTDDKFINAGIPFLVDNNFAETAGSGNWSDVNTWVGQYRPQFRDRVIINSNHVVRLPENFVAECNKIYLAAPAKLTYSPNSKVFYYRQP